ncbi:hypothetical protein CWI42_031180 [Ordospora colligata]|uniref:Uncharacterized protein n=1 Tax=Ordospora colligata OC4 TaxID=1354746 RepID=A0A0B2UM04_9MICR|nr:uncharacterized protein M896_030890 [Ordospora colligata OC4]KHN70102.1 hypothetical protein M896_030890 [Ordospora colligata OC4]TBU16484.1 hypothetical protein CWI41_030850 [Ordospora colligata]TBU16669.1 hypothetical protein CWI40_031250 [Ordospora colligata]TBU19242.1 hypothetical protein CWI42_031180 [Ordospora colligata]
MSRCDVALRIFEATGNSFVVGSISVLLSNALRREGLIEQPVRNGGEMAKQSMVYSLIGCGLNMLGISGYAKQLFAPFASSFVCGLRNGRRFGVKNAMSGLLGSFGYEMINKARGY